MRRKVVIYILFFLGIIPYTFGQYTGGNGNGFSTVFGMFSGPFFYEGGNGDGFTTGNILGDTSGFYLGSISDGFEAVHIFGDNTGYYVGANGDGFHSFTWQNELINTYKGAKSDGFALSDLFEKYIWSGDIGSGWLVAGNWVNGKIPGVRHEVLIPATANTWPAVNAGTLRIGKDFLDEAEYVCRSILIESGATMTTRVNCFVENYTQLFIQGTMQIKNSSIGAFQNNPGSTINISGEFLFTEQ